MSIRSNIAAPALRLVGLCFAFATLGAGPAKADCTNADLRSRIAEVEDAYRRFDWPAVSASMAQVEHETECLSEWLDSEGAARLHLAHGLSAWALRDEEQVDMALRGVFAARPDYQLDASFALEGGDLRLHFDAARLWVPTEGTPSQALPPGTWTLDGRLDGPPPTPRRAIVVQALPAGETIRTWYLADGTPNDELAALIGRLTPREPLSPDSPDDAISRARPPRALPRVAVAVGAAAAVSLGSNLAAYSRGMNHPELSDEDYDRLRNVTRVTAPAAIGLGGGAAVLGVVAVITR